MARQPLSLLPVFPVAAEVVVERQLWASHAVDGLRSASQLTSTRNNRTRGTNEGVGAVIGADT